MKIAELMTREVRTCSVEDTLDRPARQMWEGNVGCIPVLDAESHVVGIVTDRDIAMAACLDGRPLNAMLVQSVMAGKLVTCRADDELTAVLRDMQTYRVRRVPVVDPDGWLRGVVTIDDIACAALHHPDKLEAHAVATTLGRICEPRALAAPPPVAVSARSQARPAP
jgi:CBS domain-containing protein